MKRRPSSDVALILARLKTEAEAKAFDDTDLYYARALARSCAESHVKKLRCDD